MHELSIVMSIVNIAQQQAADASATTIEEIEIDIGCLSTIEMNAFEFAWRQGVKQTILAQAAKKINRIKGKGICSDCDEVFVVENVYDACPVCKGHFINITEGKELRVRSLVVAEG